MKKSATPQKPVELTKNMCQDKVVLHSIFCVLQWRNVILLYNSVYYSKYCITIILVQKL